MPEAFDINNPGKSVENFLKTIFALQQTEERVSTNALADALEITAPSVTDMARRLMDAGAVDYVKYKGVRLTEMGEDIALKMLRRHRLIELYLVQELGYALHEVHEEAEVLEHAVSDQFVEAIARKLNHPQFDPHGDPIPAPDGSITARDLIALPELPADTPAIVRRFKTDHAEMIQHILERGFDLQAHVQLTDRDPFDGPVSVQINGEPAVIGYQTASAILVEIVD